MGAGCPSLHTPGESWQDHEVGCDDEQGLPGANRTHETMHRCTSIMFQAGRHDQEVFPINAHGSIGRSTKTW